MNQQANLLRNELCGKIWAIPARELARSVAKRQIAICVLERINRCTVFENACNVANCTKAIFFSGFVFISRAAIT